MNVVKHLEISGRVQGVGFRYFVVRAARELGLTGWVRNRHDGSVEAMVAGEAAAVDALIDSARRGPAQAMVTACRVSAGAGSYDKFEMRPTG